MPYTANAADLLPEITMGVNDAAQCMRGWWPLEDFGDGHGPVRWVADEGQARLLVPPGVSHVGVELWAPPSWRAPRAVAQLTVRDPWVGRAADFGPTVDVAFALRPGRWTLLECPLPLAPLPPGATLDVALRIERPAPRWPHRMRPGEIPRSAAVRRLWLRGPRLRAADVTIVVLNWKHADETIECLESLDQADLDGARVLVVDNGSGDGSVERIRARFPDQPIVALAENRGYAGGNNAGIRAALDAGAQAVLLLNNDTRVARDFLLALLWVLDSDRAVAAVSASILRQDHPELLDIAYLELFWGHGIVYRRGVNALPGEGFNARRDVDAAVGSCVLMTADALRDIGPLDERYFAYHEEVDWCLRARRRGYRIVYEPLARVWHGGSKSTEAMDQPLRTPRRRGAQLDTPIPLSWNPVRTYLGGRNTVRFVRLNGGWRERAYFLASSAYNVPLEFLAMLMREEEALKIGAFGYRRALALYCFEDGDGVSAAPPLAWPRAALRLLALPFALARETRRAHREGRDAQVIELLRGLWDGVLDRPLPLERLGLR